MAKIVKILLISLLTFHAYGSTHPEIRVAVLQFGTVNWEIDVIQHHQLDKKHNFSLNVIPVGSKNSSAVALQSKAVDVIFSDWIWVNRQRFSKRMYSFSPASSAAGGLYAQPESAIKSLHELGGLRVGVAGGSVDKSWLMLQAYARKEHRLNLQDYVQPVYVAPPLLNKLMDQGRLPLGLNFWHYSARLKAKGFKPILMVKDIVKGLGIQTQVPLVGWVFEDKWKSQNGELLDNFLKASLEARQILLNSDEEWLRIRPLTHAENDDVFNALKNGYREGVLERFSERELESLDRLYAIMAAEGGDALTGGADVLDRDLFYIPASVGDALLDQGGLR